MLTITFAGDESGDVSFNFGKGASRYFVMAVIATTKPEDLRQSLAEVRDEFGLYSSPEKFFPSSRKWKRRRCLVKLKHGNQALDFLAHNTGQFSRLLFYFFDDLHQVCFQVSQRFPATIVDIFAFDPAP